MNRYFTELGFAAFALLCASACARVQEEQFAEGVVTSALATNENESVGKETVDVDQTCIDDPEIAAQNAASRPTVVFVPSTCETKTADGNTVHVELDNCSGRFGRATIDGGLDAVITRAGECQLHADVTDNGDLTANGRPLDYSASADVRLLDGERDIDWHASWAGDTRNGRHVEQESDLTILADNVTNCVDVSGDAHGSVDEYDYSFNVESLAVCPDACPSAGIVHARMEGKWRDRSIVVQFDGSAEAHVTGWSGRHFDVHMTCTPGSN